LAATSASRRASSRSRCALPGGYPRRSGETNVATVSAWASRSARYERLGSPGSKPWTTSKRPSASASERFARAPTGTPIRLRREIGTAGPSATRSACSPSSSARRPAARSRARFEEARIVTEWPSRRSSSATPATCSLTSCGCDQANGVTRQILRPATAPSVVRPVGLAAPSETAPTMGPGGGASPHLSLRCANDDQLVLGDRYFAVAEMDSPTGVCSSVGDHDCPCNLSEDPLGRSVVDWSDGVTLEDRRQRLSEDGEDEQHCEQLPAVAALRQNHGADRGGGAQRGK